MENKKAAEPKKKNKALPFILGGLVIVIAIVGFNKISYRMANEETENSQLQCHIVPITPRIGGFVVQLNVKENQKVKKGDTLVKIDQRDLKIKVQQAEIALANAEANLDVLKNNVQTANSTASASNANISTVQANYDAAKIRVKKTTQDFERYKKLLEEKSATQQQFDNYQAEKETADKQLIAAQTQLEGAKEQSAASNSQAGGSGKQIKLAELNIDQKKSELEMAKLQLSYASILAPNDGYVSKKNVEEGQLVNAGQSLFSLIDDSSFWITANFKETQIEKMKVGQPVVVTVDAYPGKTFEGTIESIQAATGSQFSLLPADNASGNFVKVVQRIPLRIAMNNKNNEDCTLRAGMNVEVAVRIK